MSDIHGNTTALRAVIADANAIGVDHWWVLGDIVALGPDPVGVLEILAELPNVEAIAGNTEWYVLTGDGPHPTVEHARLEPGHPSAARRMHRFVRVDLRRRRRDGLAGMAEGFAKAAPSRSPGWQPRSGHPCLTVASCRSPCSCASASRSATRHHRGLPWHFEPATSVEGALGRHWRQRCCRCQPMSTVPSPPRLQW